MFQFEEYQILWFLLLLPLAVGWFAIVQFLKKKAIKKHTDLKVFRRLYQGWSEKLEWLKVLFVITGIGLAIVAWSNPQWGTRKEKVKAQSSDVIIALDISQSMLAEDISPNRMERSKRFVSELINALRTERIGLVFFAGGAYLQMPLSSDYASAKLFVQSANPQQAGTQGTVIADAIKLSEQVFGQDNPTQKALIIISDGENHDTEAIEAAKAANSKGTFVFTLGIGSDEGAYIPVIERGKKVYKKDNNGVIVKSILNKQLLQDIAEAGGGEFYMIDQTLSAVENLKSEIARLEKQEVEQKSFTDYNSYFQYFLLLGWILLVLEFFIPNKFKNKNKWKERLSL
ncbi:MAG: VWA domain-containing protein [Saprospiraceae bacterium]|nr:VWA domain-containing protein [Saprospiraceae bacterium]